MMEKPLRRCSPSPQRGEARWGETWKREGMGARSAPVGPPPNLSCATVWAQRASRFLPLGGGRLRKNASLR